MRTYRRDEWAQLAPDAPIPPDLAPNGEIREIYAPLAELIRQQKPYIVGVTGSVAVGKSTFCRTLQTLLQAHSKVEVVSTDGFLLPNWTLTERGIMHRKGFPESYDQPLIANFFTNLQARQPVEVPIYSHETYDRLEGPRQTLESADLIIFEGVAALQYPQHLDFSIYLDAAEEDIEAWFLTRVQALRATAESNSYYWQFRDMPEADFAALARQVWRDVNLVNLRTHILPTRAQANLILYKAKNHAIEKVTIQS